MKSLKNIFLLVLGSLFLLSACAGLQPSKPVITNPTVEEKAPDIYVKHDCWKSPFDPHKILKDWPKLTIKPVSGSMVLLIAGNPKINWKEDYQIGTPFSSMPVPEGEITSVVMFVFARIAGGTIELAVFAYKDKDGVKYTYIWNEQKDCYVIEPGDGQKACAKNYFTTSNILVKNV